MVIEHFYATKRESLMQLFLNSDYYKVEWIYTGNLFLITHSLHEALLTAEKNRLHPAKEKIMLNLAHIYEKNDSPEDAIKWYKRCLNEPHFSPEHYQADILASLILNMIECREYSQIDEYMMKLSLIKRIQEPCLRDSLNALKFFLHAKIGYSLKNIPDEEIKSLLAQSRMVYQETAVFSLMIPLDSMIEEMNGDLSNSNKD